MAIPINTVSLSKNWRFQMDKSKLEKVMWFEDAPKPIPELT